MISMGKSLKQRVLAEGVETAEQLAFLRTLLCDEAQGFLFSHPLPASAFELLLPPTDTASPDDGRKQEKFVFPSVL